MKKLLVFKYKILIMALGLLLIGQFLYAQEDRTKTPRYIFYNANRLYEEAKFDEAIAEYEKLLKDNLESSSLYYNIGNCFFKKGELGRAILNYERARRLAPGDSDIESNYEYAKSLLKERPSSESKFLIIKLLHKLSEKVSIDWLTISLSILYISICLGFIILIFFKNLRGFCRSSILVLAIFFILNIVLVYGKLVHLGKEAIIITKIADVKFEPLDSATTYFVLSEGSLIEIIESKNDWYKIRRSDGKLGWVSKSNLEVI